MQRLKMNSACAHTLTIYTHDLIIMFMHTIYTIRHITSCIFTCAIYNVTVDIDYCFIVFNRNVVCMVYTCYVMCVMAAVQIFTVPKLFIRMRRKYNNNSRVSDCDYSLSYIYIANVRTLSFVLHYVLYTFETANIPTSII